MENKAVIYARVSSTSDRQSNDRQIADLSALAAARGLEIDKVYEERLSGAARNKPVLQECLDYCRERPGITLLVSEISRLGRSPRLVVDALDELTTAGVNVLIQNLGLSTLNPDGSRNTMVTMITTVLSSFADIERETIKYRLNSGRARAIERGVRMGRPAGSGMSDDDILIKRTDVVRYLKKGYSTAATAKLCGCSQSTVARVRAILKGRNKI